MKVRKILSIAIVSALLAACSSSGGSSSSGGGNTSIPSGPSSLSSVPAQYRNDVSKEKTFDLVHDDGHGFSAQTILAGKTDSYNLSDLPNGVSRLPISETYGDSQGTTTYSGTMLVYQQPYSVVMGTTYTQGSGAEYYIENLNLFESGGALGLATSADARQKLITENAIFEYKGVAFDGKEEATLNYTMSFGTREGYGSINGFASTGSIRLWVGHMTNDGFVRGDVRLDKDPNSSVKYELSFFGPNAEEVAGEVYDEGARTPQGQGPGLLGYNEIIFAGKGLNSSQEI